MLLFKAILLAVFLIYLLECIILCIYRNLLYISKVIAYYSNKNYSLLSDRDMYSSSYKRYLNLQAPTINNDIAQTISNTGQEQNSGDLKLSKLFLRAFVSLWLFCFLHTKIFNQPRVVTCLFYSLVSLFKNKTASQKNIKALL